MKTYKNLWNQFISFENFELAAKKAVKSKKCKKSTLYFIEHKQELLEKLRNDLITGKYKTSNYHTFTIYEPKKRVIYELPLYPDHIVHHALINILGLIWQSTFINDSYACIPGKGLHKASQRTMHFMRRNKYVLQCDIRKFFPSINHEIMFNIIKRKIHDRRLLNVLREIIFSVGGETNLPIGNLTSQWMGNVYLNELDHFIKEQLKCKDYIRYCDDFLIFGNDKKELWKIEKIIKIYITENLNMVLSKSDVKRTKNGVSFIGYRHFKKFVLLRKYGARRLKKRIMNIIKYKDFKEKSVMQMASAFGWVKWCCSYNFKINILTKADKSGWFVKKYLLRIDT